MQNLNLIYEENLSTLNIKINNSGFLISKDVIVELKFKIERVLDEYYKKVNNLNEAGVGANQNNKNDKNSKKSKSLDATFSLVKFLNLNFERSEIFTKTSSINMLNSTIKLISNIILLLSEKIDQPDHKLYSNYAEKSPAKFESNQQYIIYFFEILINLDENLKKLTINNEEYRKFYNKNENLKKELEDLKENLTNRMGRIIIKNFRENFLVKYDENVKNKIASFIIRN